MIDIKNLRKHYDEAPRGQAQGAQTDWLGFCKGVRTYVQRAPLMRQLQETDEEAIHAASRDG